MNYPNTASSAPSGRIVFIDILRAYAILMMLQGHFVDTLLAETYRTSSSILYSLWSFMRGMTAPIFFTVTGLVFTYLLLRDGRSFTENKRVKKGIRRGFYLIGVGYLLKINFPGLLVGYLSSWVWAIDVLHIIGIALLCIIAVVGLRAFIGGSLVIWMLALGVGTFLFDPFFTENTWEHLPRFMAHYLTRDFGSNFTIVPWVGFAFFGGALGYIISKRPRLAFTNWFPLFLMAFGWVLTLGSWQILVNLYELTGWDYLPVLYNNNYLFWRLGHVLITMSVFMWVIPRIPALPPLISKIGGETLTIYGAHYVLLYGTWLGLGLSQIIGYRSLSPIPCIIGAVSFVGLFVLMIKYIEPIREIVYRKIPIRLKYGYRKAKIWYLRYSRPLVVLKINQILAVFKRQSL